MIQVQAQGQGRHGHSVNEPAAAAAAVAAAAPGHQCQMSGGGLQFACRWLVVCCSSEGRTGSKLGGGTVPGGDSAAAAWVEHTRCSRSHPAPSRSREQARGPGAPRIHQNIGYSFKCKTATKGMGISDLKNSNINTQNAIRMSQPRRVYIRMLQPAKTQSRAETQIGHKSTSPLTTRPPAPPHTRGCWQLFILKIKHCFYY